MAAEVEQELELGIRNIFRSPMFWGAKWMQSEVQVEAGFLPVSEQGCGSEPGRDTPHEDYHHLLLLPRDA